MQYINNYNQYNKFNDSYGLITMIWDKSPPEEELYAQYQYKLINLDDLLCEFEDVIKEGQESQNAKAKSKYDRKVGYFNRKGLKRNDIDIEMKSFIRESVISLNNSDNKFYRELICQNKAKRRFSILKKINDSRFYIHKLLFINDFEKNFLKVSELKGLYNNYYLKKGSNNVDLKSLFVDQNYYNRLVEDLLSKGIVVIKSNNQPNNFKFNNDIIESDISYPRLASAFGYVLLTKNKLNTKSKPKIAAGLRQFFNISFSDESNRKSFKFFEESGNKSKDYTTHFNHLV